METDDGLPLPPSRISSTEEEKNVAYRSPIKGVRKRFDIRPSTPRGEDSLRNAADQKRITEMITELIDIRARMQEGTSSTGKLPLL